MLMGEGKVVLFEPIKPSRIIKRSLPKIHYLLSQCEIDNVLGVVRFEDDELFIFDKWENKPLIKITGVSKTNYEYTKSLLNGGSLDIRMGVSMYLPCTATGEVLSSDLKGNFYVEPEYVMTGDGFAVPNPNYITFHEDSMKVIRIGKMHYLLDGVAVVYLSSFDDQVVLAPNFILEIMQALIEEVRN